MKTIINILSVAAILMSFYSIGTEVYEEAHRPRRSGL